MDRGKRGELTYSLDEMTGIQALERQMPDIPMKPGRIKALLNQHPDALKTHLVMDCLNTHQSEALVRIVAALEEKPPELGEKGKSGILKSMKTRSEFLRDHSHRLVIHFTPKHCSWLNQIEIWFSILVRKLLRRSSFNSKAQLKSRILEFVDYFNHTMAKPFKWTYKGKPLTA